MNKDGFFLKAEDMPPRTPQPQKWICQTKRVIPRKTYDFFIFIFHL